MGISGEVVACCFVIGKNTEVDGVGEVGRSKCEWGKGFVASILFHADEHGACIGGGAGRCVCDLVIGVKLHRCQVAICELLETRGIPKGTTLWAVPFSDFECAPCGESGTFEASGEFEERVDISVEDANELGFCDGTYVPDTKGVISLSCSCCEVCVVWGENRAMDGREVSRWVTCGGALYGGDECTGVGIPDADIGFLGIALCSGSGHEVGPIQREAGKVDAITVWFQGEEFFLVVDIPDACCAVDRGGCQSGAIGRKVDMCNGAGMSFEYTNLLLAAERPKFDGIGDDYSDEFVGGADTEFGDAFGWSSARNEPGCNACTGGHAPLGDFTSATTEYVGSIRCKVYGE